MDFAIETSTTDPRVDTRWRTSKHGEDNARPGALDVDTFVDGTHYNIGARTDSVIPSGVAVQKNDDTGLYEPFNPTPHVPADAWVKETAYELGDRVSVTGGVVLVCTTAGTSGAGSAPTAPAEAGDTVSDGTVVWTREVAAVPLAGFINDDAGIALYSRAGGTKSTKAAFALLVHGIVDASYLPVSSQASVVASAASTGSFVYA